MRYKRARATAYHISSGPLIRRNLYLDNAAVPQHRVKIDLQTTQNTTHHITAPMTGRQQPVATEGIALPQTSVLYTTAERVYTTPATTLPTAQNQPFKTSRILPLTQLAHN